MRQSNRLIARVAFVASGLVLACESDGARPGVPSAPPPSPLRPSAQPEDVRDAGRSGASRAGKGAIALGGAAGVDDAGLWAACHAGFRTGGRPRADVTRLGMLCGPSNGMTRAGPLVTGQLDEADDVVVGDVEVTSAECWRVFAAAGGSVADLEIEVLSSDGRPLVLENLDAPWVVARRAAPLCLSRPGRYQLRLRTHTGRGPYAAQIWRYKM